MALNKQILIKIKEQTDGKSDIQEFLIDIFQFESTPIAGWYSKEYTKLLEKYCKEYKA